MLVRDMDGAPHKRVAGAVLFFAAITLSMVSGLAGGNKSAPAARPKINALEPPEKEFFAKEVLYENIPIKAPGVVVDEALYAAYGNLSRILTNLPMIASNLVAAGGELHIIGRDQVTTDLPEWRHDKGKPLAEYNGLTRDQRTRGMGGRLTSCGEENLLKLQKDKYLGVIFACMNFPTAFAITEFQAACVRNSTSNTTARWTRDFGRVLTRAPILMSFSRS